MFISLAGIAEQNNKYFMALRKPGTTIGESWEFPGGKSEPGESHEETLIREYQEEFSVQIIVGKQLFKTSFTSKDRVFDLFAYEIFFQSKINALPEHQKTDWIRSGNFKKFPMADSDKKIAAFLKNQ